MSEPRIVFGVGASRAQTGWLYRYLAAHPDCKLRGLKELHYFDALDHGRLGRQLAEFEHQCAELPKSTRADCRAWVETLRSGENDQGYLEYLSQEADGHLTADITPAYSLLSFKRLQSMATIAPQARFVYLMRDPVDRLWSHVRSIARQRSEKDGMVEGRAEHILTRVFSGDEREIVIRSDYKSALLKLAQAVPAGRLLVTVSEHLSSVASVTNLCAFLGIRVAAPTALDVSDDDARSQMDDKTWRQARAWLDEQYDFVADWMGARPAGWNYALQRI